MPILYNGSGYRKPQGEPHYETDEDLQPQKRPKWMIPTKPMEIKILEAVGRKYYKTRAEKTTVLKIAEAVLPLTSGMESYFPQEWVEFCCQWARNKRREREMVGLLGLVHFIQNEDSKGDFLRKWMKEHGKVETSLLEDDTPPKEKGGFLDGE